MVEYIIFYVVISSRSEAMHRLLQFMYVAIVQARRQQTEWVGAFFD